MQQLEASQSKAELPKGVVIDIFKQPVLCGICQGLVAMVKNKTILSLSLPYPLSLLYVFTQP